MPRNSKKSKIKKKLPNIITVFIMILGLIIIYFVFQGQEAKAEWFNDNWMYRKAIPISYSGNETLTEYQILIDGLNTATLISNGKMQSDCDDIRFTSQGGNLLHYSIVGNTCNTSDTKIWVKTNEISSNGATIFLYYGNPSVQSYQSESKTFSYSNEKTIGYVLHSVVNDLQIISLEEDNSITHNSVTRTLGKYETSSFTSISQWGSINAKKLFNADDLSGNTDLFVPVSWAGTEFYFYSRDAAETLYLWMLAPWQDATVTVYVGGVAITGCTSISVTSSGSDTACSNVDAGAIRVSSNYPILVFTQPTNGDDQMPVHPATSQKWLGGGVSTVLENGNAVLDYRYYYDTTADEQDPADASANTNTGLSGDSGFGGGAILVRSANSEYNYGVLQYGDGDGGDSHFFNDETEQGTRFGSANQADYISIASTQDATCSVYNVDSSSPIATQTLTSSNTFVYHYGFNTATSTIYTSGAWYMECDKPVVAHYQKAVDSESNLMHYPMMRQFTYPTPSIGSLGSEEQSPGPVAYWKFDEGADDTCSGGTNDVCDSTQNGNDGARTNAVWQSEDTCISGKCLYFDGSGDIVSVTDTSSSPLDITDAVTVSAWINVKGYPVPQASFDGIAGKQGSYALLIDSCGTPPNFMFSINGVLSGMPGYCDSSSRLSTNEWTFVVGTYDKDAGGTTEVKLYVDGKLVDTTDYSTAIATNDNSFDIGDVGTFATADAWIDEVKIYPYAQSVDQIKADYLSGIAGTGGSAASVSFGAKPQKWLSDGLVGYWKMDESSWGTAIDSSGNENNGTVYGGMVPGTGKFGNGGVFDGAGDYMNAGNTTSSDVDIFTVSSWIKTTGTGYKMWMARGAGQYWLSHQSSQLHFCLTTSTGRKDLFATVNYYDNNWHHVANTYDGAYMRMYMDGVEINSFAKTGTISGLTDLLIGRYNVDYQFTGSVDDVRIYNRALSSKEVRDLYNWAPGPVAYWKFDEHTGITTVYDRSGNANNGTMNGSMTESDWVPGKYGSALDFDGSNDYVSVANDDEVSGLPKITVEAWINPKISGVWRGIIGSEGSGAYHFQINTSNLLQFYVYGPNDDAFSITSFSGSNLNKWFHVAGTYDGSTIKVYVNGVEEGSQGGLSGDITSSNDVRIGRTYSVDRTFKGFIDDVRVYNYTRTQKQIIEDMNAGHPAVGSPVGSQIGYWKFDEGYGQTTNDSSVNSINFTLGPTSGSESNDPAWSNDGKFGKGFNFEKDNEEYLDDLNVGGNATDLTDNITITAWIKPETLAGDGVILGKDFANETAYSLSVRSDNNLEMEFWDCSSARRTITNGSAVLTTGEWQHVAGSVNDDDGTNKTLTFYHNGRQVGQTTISLCINTGDELMIGANELSDLTISREFDGLIDEVKLYNFALTQDEIKLDYNRGASVVLGAVSTDSSGNPDWSSEREYCIPGDATSCSAPVAEWKFDEKTGTTANDTSGNGNTGTLGAGAAAPQWRSAAVCKLGGCLKYETDDYISIPDANFDFPSQGALTIEAWIYLSASQSAKGLIGDYISNTGTMLWIYPENKLNYDFNDNYSVSGGGTLPVNEWVHIALTWDGTDYATYLNGAVDLSGSQGSFTDGADFYIGTYGTAYFDGLIDHAKVYDYARTPAQIIWSYNRGSPVAHWKFDECQGGIAYDSSDNSNNGTTTIGGTGSQDGVGICSDVDSTKAWYNGRNGKYNSSLNFDGTDDYVDVGSYSSLNNIGEDISVSAWVKTSINSSLHTIVGRGNDWRLNKSGSSYQFEHRNSSNNIVYPSGTNTSTNWVHVVGTYKIDTFARLYLNGVLVDSDAQTESTRVSQTQNQIGNNYAWHAGGTYNDYWWDGQIDEVKIFNYALTAEQVKTDYNQGAAIRFGPN